MFDSGGPEWTAGQIEFAIRSSPARLAIMQVGQRVVCINDKFEPWVSEYYDQLPVKGDVYTIRAVSLGRGTLVGSEMAEVRLLLEELHNGPDPHHKDGGELGFRSDRFAPFEEEELTAAAEQEAHVGFPMGQ